MFRNDRSNSSLRPLSVTLESLDRVDGSAAFAFGQTKVLASVSGPIQVRLATESPSKATFEVIVRPLSGIPGTESKALAATLRTLLTPSLVLTQNPRTLIQLVVQFLAPSSHIPSASITAASINASTVALMRTASFPMLGVICAAAVGRVKSTDDTRSRTLLLDPTEEEAQQCDAIGCVAIMFGSTRTESGTLGNLNGDQGEVVWSSFEGSPLQDDYDALLRLAKSGARSVYEAMRERMELAVESLGNDTETHAKKMPKNRGGRIALNVSTDEAMDTT